MHFGIPHRPYTPLDLSDIYKTSAARPLNPLQMQQAMMNKAKMAQEATSRGILGDPRMNPMDQVDALIRAGDMTMANNVLSNIHARAGEARSITAAGQATELHATRMDTAADAETERDRLVAQGVATRGIVTEFLGGKGENDFKGAIQVAEEGGHMVLRDWLVAAETSTMGLEDLHSDRVREAGVVLLEALVNMQDVMNSTARRNDLNGLVPGNEGYIDPETAGHNFAVATFGEGVVDVTDMPGEVAAALAAAGGKKPEGTSWDGNTLSSTADTTKAAVLDGVLHFLTNDEIRNLGATPLERVEATKAPIEVWDTFANDGSGGYRLVETATLLANIKANPDRYTKAPKTATKATYNQKTKTIQFSTEAQIAASNGNLIPVPAAAAQVRAPLLVWDTKAGEKGDWVYVQIGTMIEHMEADPSRYSKPPEDAPKTKAVYDKALGEMVWGTEAQIAASNGNLVPKPDNPRAPLAAWDADAKEMVWINHQEWIDNPDKYGPRPDDAPQQHSVFDNANQKMVFVTNEEMEKDRHNRYTPMQPPAARTKAVYDEATDKNVLKTDKEIADAEAAGTPFGQAKLRDRAPMEVWNNELGRPVLASIEDILKTPNNFAPIPEGMEVVYQPDGTITITSGRLTPEGGNLTEGDGGIVGTDGRIDSDNPFFSQWGKDRAMTDVELKNAEKMAEQAIGPGAGVGQFFANVFGFLPGIQAQDTQEARTWVRIFVHEVIPAFILNPRFPVNEVATIRGFLPNPDKFWSDPQYAALQMTNLRKFMTGLQASNQTEIDQGGIGEPHERDLANMNSQIDTIVRMMGDPAGYKPEGAGAKADPNRSFRPAQDFTGMTKEDLGKVKLEDLNDYEWAKFQEAWGALR